jgi:hypothetical protein
LAAERETSFTLAAERAASFTFAAKSANRQRFQRNCV